MTDKAILGLLQAPQLTLSEARNGPQRVLNVPGLYAIHAEPGVWKQLGLGCPPDERPLYVGKSEDDLAGRDIRQHFTGRTGSSTVRRTLASLLAADLELVGVPRNLGKPDGSANFALTTAGELRLSEWMECNLRIAVWTASPGVVLSASEKSIIGQLSPPLNLDFNRASPWRRAVRAARAAMISQSRSF